MLMDSNEHPLMETFFLPSPTAGFFSLVFRGFACLLVCKGEVSEAQTGLELNI